ncbi:MAG: helix-turn-helix transcriptional regulator [Dietzia sp.]
MNLAVVDTDTGQHFWTVRQCAEHCGISPATWRSYVGRGQCPAPTTKFEGSPLWDADEVRAWHAVRPGSPVSNSPTGKAK